MSTRPSITRRSVNTPDGRELAVYEGGNPTGTAIFIHPGTPGSGRLYDDWLGPAAALGVRLVSWDRPGYGGSTPQPGRRVADVADDAAAVADALGIDELRTWGISGGGPHALACAALLPGRVRAVASLAGVGPSDDPTLDFLAGMGEDNIVEFGAAMSGEPELRAFLEPAWVGLRDALATDPEAVVGEMSTLLPDVDAAYLRRQPQVLATMAEGVARGYEGWLEDDLAFATGWGFDLAAISVPTLLLQGDLDLMVPKQHGPHLARAIPGAELRELSGEGHLTLLDHLDEVHRWLLAR